MAKVKKRVALQKIKERAAAARPKARTLVDHVKEEMLARADERRAQRREKMTTQKPRHDEDDEPKRPYQQPKPADKPIDKPADPKNDPMSTPPDPPPAPKEPA